MGGVQHWGGCIVDAQSSLNTIGGPGPASLTGPLSRREGIGGNGEGPPLLSIRGSWGTYDISFPAGFGAEPGRKRYWYIFSLKDDGNKLLGVLITVNNKISVLRTVYAIITPPVEFEMFICMENSLFI